MIVDPDRIDRFIEEKGYVRRIDVDGWRSLVSFVLSSCDPIPNYRFSTVTQVKPPIKQVYVGFPKRLLDIYHYLHILELFLLVDRDRELVRDFLDRHGFPWEPMLEYDWDAEKDVEVGIRILGFDREAGLREGNTSGNSNHGFRNENG